MYGTPLPGVSKETDKYGFIDEREIRIATGITLVLGLFSLFLVLFKAEYEIPLVIVSILFLDFLARVIFSPKFSLFGSIVRVFLKKDGAIWVGTVQKRFAWSVGLVLTAFVLFCLILLGGYSGIEDPMLQLIRDTTKLNINNGALVVVPMNPAIIACVLCVIFMWSESIAGYCVGCAMYAWLVKKGWMKKYEGQNCVNGLCEL